MKQGFVFSDLHLFAQRCNNAVLEQVIQSIPENSDFLVLNGDIIDFRWSHHRKEDATIHAGLEWIKTLQSHLPKTKFYYVMGNHDCSQPWSRALDTLRSDSFQWSPTHFRLGNALFLHGDLPLEIKNPFHRPLLETSHNMPLKPVMVPLYDAILAIHAHKILAAPFSPKLCSSLISKTLSKYPHADSNGIEHIYFGHTHRPFHGYLYNRVHYYNTGSSIRHLKPNALRVQIND